MPLSAVKIRQRDDGSKHSVNEIPSRRRNLLEAEGNLSILCGSTLYNIAVNGGSGVRNNHTLR